MTLSVSVSRGSWAETCPKCGKLYQVQAETHHEIMTMMDRCHELIRQCDCGKKKGKKQR